jgi:hypothetical protein
MCYSQLNGTTSTHFPLWVITFWEAVIDARKLVVKWAASKDWVCEQLCHRKSAEIRVLAQEALSLMDSPPYGVSKTGGLSDTEPIHELWRYLGANWLEASHMNDHLELLRRETPSQGGNPTPDGQHSQSIHVEVTALMSKVMKAFEAHGDGSYQSENEYKWLRDLGDELVQNQLTIVTVVYLGDITKSKHWVPLVVANRGADLYYGDSFGQPIPAKLREAYRWWINMHGYSSMVLKMLISDLSALSGSYGLRDYGP